MFKLNSKNFPLKEEAETFKTSNQLSLALKTKSGFKINLSSISLKNESRKLNGLSVSAETVLRFRRIYISLIYKNIDVNSVINEKYKKKTITRFANDCESL